MKKETAVKSAQAIGDVINDLSSSPLPFPFEVGGQTFDLFIHPATSEDLEAIKASMGTGEFNDEVLKIAVTRTLKDSQGNPVWQKPENIKLSPVVWARLRAVMLRVHFGIDLTKLEVK